MSLPWRTQLSEVADRMLALVLPPICVACNRIEGTRALELGLCRSCRDRLCPTPDQACAACNRTVAVGFLPAGYLCGRCRLDPPPFQRLYSGWSYESPLEEVIHALKFRRLSFLGEALGVALYQRYQASLNGIDLVVPVPLHWRRRLGRGFNQAEEIARPLAVGLDLPLVRALRRERATRPQTGLGRSSRAANLRRAFGLTAAGRRGVRGSRILLVDDVVTTRNTLEAACSCLLASGAQTVTCLTAGRTPHPSRAGAGLASNCLGG
jgi:ComF family protein